jgi:hypothetical protein
MRTETPLIKTTQSNLLRDAASHSLINTDVEKYKHYKLLRDQNNQIMQMLKEILVLKEEVTSIKSKLQQIVKEK